jgi:hypothetical protein
MNDGRIEIKENNVHLICYLEKHGKLIVEVNARNSR